MFIDIRHENVFSPVGTECLWTCHWYPHIVPTGLRVRLFRFFYKHIVPTGLNMGQFQSP